MRGCPTLVVLRLDDRVGGRINDPGKTALALVDFDVAHVGVDRQLGGAIANRAAGL